MATTDAVQQQVKQVSQNLGHEGFIYLYFQDGRVKMVGDASISVFAPLLANVLASKMGLGTK